MVSFNFYKNMKILATFVLLLYFGCIYSTTEYSTEHRIAPDEMTIVFSGDFMQHSPQFKSAACSDCPLGYDYDTQLRSLTPIWRAADYSIINLETTLSPKPPYSGYPMFCAPSAVAYALKRAGITHCALANNHTLDRGKLGVSRTLSALDSAQLNHFGAATDTTTALYTILEKGSLRVGILNGTYGTNGIPTPKGVELNSSLDTTQFLSEIKELQTQGVSHLIAFVHWGEEYQTMPNKSQKRLAHWFKNKGINLVVGSHPHVAQPIDTLNSIVYSLGNFVSNQTKTNTDTGYSVKITITEGKEKVKIDYISHWVDISGAAQRKYSILPLKDTLEVAEHTWRNHMKGAIHRVEKIVNTPVKYD